MSPPEVLREHLAAARAARIPFDDAWPDAIEAAVDGEREAADWRSALEETQLAWEAAFERWPAVRAELALHAVASDDEREPVDDGHARERVCRHCTGPIPASRRRTARYCSDACQRLVHGRRAPSAAA